uniref:Uncharacterized protein n=1 Tax=Meloidogyne hapla TaxID=6305 RepID=A0A1I8B7K3_MELHA
MKISDLCSPSSFTSTNIQIGGERDNNNIINPKILNNFTDNINQTRMGGNGLAAWIVYGNGGGNNNHNLYGRVDPK